MRPDYHNKLKMILKTKQTRRSFRRKKSTSRN